MADPVLERLYLGRITPGMDVCDVTGDKIGTVAHVYRFDDPAQREAAAGSDEEYIEVKTGFLGLGKHLYIPLSAVQEVLTDSVFLSKSKDAFEALGYETRPSHLDRLR